MGGLRFLTGRTQKGGGVIQMRTVCNRGGGGGGESKHQEKMRL